jgi:hypothetical protein
MMNQYENRMIAYYRLYTVVACSICFHIIILHSRIIKE